jgi:RHS repeat-associated protein
VNSVTTQLYGWAAQTVNYTWDAAGNLTNDGLRTYTYDAAGRQKEAGATGQNTVGYDGDGQRVRKIENWGTPVYYVRSSVLKNAAMEVVGGTLARAYVYTGKKLVALQGTDGQFYWVHQDHLNSARKLTNTSGAVVYRGEFDPHGQALLETGSALLNSRKYTGYERDQATGLDYARARMYQSNTARFTSPDPTSLRSADPRRPESLNRYSYVENDPINAVDPGGTNLEAPDGSSRRSCRFIYGFRGPDEEDIYTFGIVGISCSEVGGGGGGGVEGTFDPVDRAAIEELKKCTDQAYEGFQKAVIDLFNERDRSNARAIGAIIGGTSGSVGVLLAATPPGAAAAVTVVATTSVGAIGGQFNRDLTDLTTWNRAVDVFRRGIQSCIEQNPKGYAHLNILQYRMALSAPNRPAESSAAWPDYLSSFRAVAYAASGMGYVHLINSMGDLSWVTVFTGPPNPRELPRR